MVCLGDQYDIDRAKHLGLDAMSADEWVSSLKELSKNKKLNKMAQKYDLYLASESLIKLVSRLLGRGLSKAGAFPTSVPQNEDLDAKLDEAISTTKFSSRKCSA
ncbi:60S ribosomal protein L10a [Thelotrema lepadinum]|nr:60S ribosomal protein L10a [Thelotrema lepadinum]